MEEKTAADFPTLRCRKHYGYQAIRRPMGACPECWVLFGHVHPDSFAGEVVLSIEKKGGTLRSRQVAALLAALYRRGLK